MIQELLEILRAEGEILRGALDAEISVREKTGPRDVVTAYDTLVQQHLEQKLHTLRPEAGFLGEEGLDIPHGGERFIIDPIDGTMNFSRGYRRSCISVALEREGQIVLGAVYDPYQDELFWAERGQGAFLNGRPVHVSDRPLDEGLVMFGTTPYTRELADQTFVLAKRFYLASLDLRRSGSAAIDLCAVAAGRAEAFYELLLSPWDHAAAGLIIEEAGGFVESMEGGAPSLRKRASILAANAASWETARKIAREETNQ